MKRLDLVVIGGGPGGVAAAIRGTQLGASVAIIEKSLWGGLCLNQACIPTKFISSAADRLKYLEATFAYGEYKAPSLEPSELWKQKDELSNYFSMGTKGLLTSKGIKLIEGLGRLDGPGRVTVGDVQIETKSVIISSGNIWAAPPVPGGDLDGIINSSQFLNDDQLPQTVLLLGGGPWQLELAQFLVTAGKEATVLEEGPNILPTWEEEIAQRLRAIINREPLTIFNHGKIQGFKKKDGKIRADVTVRDKETSLTVDRVIYFGRTPGLENLGLSSVGLTNLHVNERQATGAPGVFAVGDVTGQEGLSHLSSAQGICAAENALGGETSLNLGAVPKVAYTNPQVASVGLSESQAEELGFEVITGEASLGTSPMAMITGQSNGVVKVVAEEEYGEVLGVHILAPMATEIIGAGVLALQMEATLNDLCMALIPHPTIGESLTEAARDALDRAIYQAG